MLLAWSHHARQVTMPSRPCLDCGQITTRADSRCPACASAWHQRRDAARGNRHQRGYGSEHVTARSDVLAASTICWLCGHDGADQADDVIPKSHGGKSTIPNLRPAHGTRPCPTCGIRCNPARGNREPVTPTWDDQVSDTERPGRCTNTVTPGLTAMRSGYVAG